MAERLTRNNKVNFYFHDEASNMVYYKLQGLEDILEKYGIESVEELSNALEYAKVIGEILCEYGINDNENLEWFLDDYSKNQGRDFAICEERDTLRQDRDTWKMACELACEREDDCYVYDNIHRAYEFYQQAKKAKKEKDEQSN